MTACAQLKNKNFGFNLKNQIWMQLLLLLFVVRALETDLVVFVECVWTCARECIQKNKFNPTMTITKSNIDNKCTSKYAECKVYE